MSQDVNVNRNERLASAFAGSALVAYGLIKRQGASSLFSVISGLPLIWRSVTGNCPIYSALGIDTSEQITTTPFQTASAPNAPSMPLPSHVTAETDTGVTSGKPIHVEHSIVIEKPVADVFRFWSNFENLPQFMDYLENVKLFPNGTSRWTAKAPLGTKVEWDAEIADAVPNELISWRSLARSSVQNEGTVEFSPSLHGDGTVVKLSMDYRPPAGALGAAVAKLFGTDPSKTIAEDLQKLKTLLEATSDEPAKPSEASKPSEQTRKYGEQLKQEAKDNKAESLDDSEHAVDQSFPASDPPANW